MQNSKDFQMYSYNQQDAMMQIDKQNTEKYKLFLDRIKPFSLVETLDEAKELAQKILPVSQEINSFRVGYARCIVINKKDIFRICLDTVDEFISYDFI